MIYNCEARKGPGSDGGAPQLREKGPVIEPHNP
jgi:hypothetical protein